MRWRYRKVVLDGWRGVCVAEVSSGGAAVAIEVGRVSLRFAKRSRRFSRFSGEGFEFRKSGCCSVVVWGFVDCFSLEGRFFS